MLRRFSINFAIFSMFIDGVIVCASLFVTTVLRPGMSTFSFIAEMAGPIEVPKILYLLLPVIWVIIFASFSIYDGKKYLRVAAEFAGLSWASIVAAISLAGILYLSYRTFSRAQFVLFVIFSYLGFLIWRSVARLIFRLQRDRPSGARKIIIVGTGPMSQLVEQRIREYPEINRAIIGYVDSSPQENFRGKLIGSIDKLGDIVKRESVSDIIIALPAHFYEQTRTAVEQVSEIPVRVWLVPGSFALALYKTSVDDLEGMPLLDLRASALDEYERLLKRVVDLIFGTLALIIALPIIGFAATLIWLEDRGPAFFVQRRVGENGKIFGMIKLRTMVVGAERQTGKTRLVDEKGNPIHKTRDDPRVTHVGRILRRFSIDELPQLFNVFKGDMSLVGPRPELPELVEKYEPWQRKRFVVPPGMTGWWQVNGRSDKPMHLHTEDDLYYIQNCSLGLDIQILIRTLWVVLIGKGSY